MLDEIASALNAAHDKGFIHRDLKPDNVFLVVNPGRIDVKLLDFGLAKLLPNAVMTNERTYRTATGAQLGTPDYMSPEQLRGDKDIDHRTDIYALGVLAFEIITGKRPKRFADGTFELAGTPAEVVGAVSFVPTELAQLVESMLAARPDDRPSLAAMRAVIKRVRPSLPSMSVVGLELAAMPPDQSLQLSGMSASKVGARPVVPTPATGSPMVPSRSPGQPSVASHSPGRPSVASPSPSARPSASQPPSQPPSAPHPPSQPPSTPHPPSQPPFTPHPPSQPPLGASGAGLRTTATVPRTKLGVPPPPVTVSRPRAIVTAPRRGSRVWLIVGILLALAAGVALALVIAT